MSKYMVGKDGQERLSFNVTIRLTREEVAELRTYGRRKHIEQSVRQLIQGAVWSGVEELWEQKRENDERQD